MAIGRHAPAAFCRSRRCYPASRPAVVDCRLSLLFGSVRARPLLFPFSLIAAVQVFEGFTALAPSHRFVLAHVFSAFFSILSLLRSFHLSLFQVFSLCSPISLCPCFPVFLCCFAIRTFLPCHRLPACSSWFGTSRSRQPFSFFVPPDLDVITVPLSSRRCLLGVLGALLQKKRERKNAQRKKMNNSVAHMCVSPCALLLLSAPPAPPSGSECLPVRPSPEPVGRKRQM